MVPIAMVGCAHIHTPSFVKRLKERGDFKVVWVWDEDKKRASKYAEELGADVLHNLSSLWNDRQIAAVVICAETEQHGPLVFTAANAKKHMFVEKPLGMTHKDAYTMSEAVERARVHFQTGYFMRSQPINLFLREQFKKGAFGKVTRVRHSNCHAGSLKGWFDKDWRWMADPVLAGCGAFGDLGTHSLDILMWIFGDVRQVAASIHPFTGKYGTCDEFGEGIINFKNGIVGTLAAGWVDYANPVTFEISGTEGHAHVVNGELFFQSAHVPNADGKGPWKDLPPALPHAFDMFLDTLTGNPGLPLATSHEAAVRCSVMEAFYEASRTQKWVQPK